MRTNDRLARSRPAAAASAASASASRVAGRKLITLLRWRFVGGGARRQVGWLPLARLR